MDGLEAGKEMRFQSEKAMDTAKTMNQANLRKSRVREKAVRRSEQAGIAKERAAEGVHGWTIEQASDAGEAMQRIAKERSFTMGDATADSIQYASMKVKETANGLKDKVTDVSLKISDTPHAIMENLRNTGSSLKSAVTGD